MTPKEKAIELIENLQRSTCYEFMSGSIVPRPMSFQHDSATLKEMAIMSIDAIVEEIKLFEYGHPVLLSDRLDFWNEVKKEIYSL